MATVYLIIGFHTCQSISFCTMEARKYLPLVLTAAICTLYLTVFFTNFTVQSFPSEYNHDEGLVENRFLIGYNSANTGDFYFTNHSSTTIPHDEINMIAVEQTGPRNDTPVILSKPPESSEDVMDTQSFHKERPLAGPNIDNSVILSKTQEQSESVVNMHKESSHSGSSMKSVTLIKPLQSAAAAQMSSREDIRKENGRLAVRKVLLLPPEPKPVPVPPTVKDRRVKNENRNILQLSPTSPGTGKSVHKDVFSSKDSHLKPNALDQFHKITDGETGQTLPKPTHRLEENTTVPGSSGRLFKSAEYERVDLGKEDSVSFRNAYAKPILTQKGVTAMQRYLDTSGRLLKHASRVANSSLHNTTAWTEHLVHERWVGRKSKAKLAKFIPRHMDGISSHQSTSFSQTTEHNLIQKGFERGNDGLLATAPSILKIHDKSNVTSFFSQTNMKNPEPKQRAFEQLNIIPHLRPPEITGSSVKEMAFDNYNKIPFLRQPKIQTTSTVLTKQAKELDAGTNIPFPRQPEPPTTPTASTIQATGFIEGTNIPFPKQPEPPVKPTVSTIPAMGFDEGTNIPFLRQPEPPTTPTRSTAQQWATEKYSNIPFLRKPDIPTTPMTPNVEQRPSKRTQNIQIMRPPSEPTPVTGTYDRIPESHVSKVPFSSFRGHVDLQILPAKTAKASDENTSPPMQHLRQAVPPSGPSSSKERSQQELLYLDMEIDYSRESTLLRNGVFRVRPGESQKPYSSRAVTSEKVTIPAPHAFHSETTRPHINEEENTDRPAANPVSILTKSNTKANMDTQSRNVTVSDHIVTNKGDKDLELDLDEGNAKTGVLTGSPAKGNDAITSPGETQNVQIEASERPAAASESHLPLPTLQYLTSEAGEYGAPVTLDYDTLSDEHRLQYAEGYKQNYFNQFVSDMVSVRRRLLDDRPTRTKMYPGKLPEVSVIISFHNEAWSTLLRSVHSILDRSTPELLREIILVDDLSDNSYLKTPLEEYIATLDKVKLIRTKTRQGVARARLIGYVTARAPVLIFMDSHTECFPGWLEPLLEGISRNPTTVTFPVITPIDPDDFSSRTSLPTHRGGFSWEGLRFIWEAIPAQEQNRRTETDPIRSPIIPGGVFAIDKDFFEKLGAFDPGMMFWGGENLELSFKVWMCNGSVHLLPCSQVGHVFRKSNPVTWPNRQVIANVNSARVAEVWMDDYKNYLYDASFLKPDNYGEITSRQAQRQRLRCHDFHWYMRNVYPEKHVPLRLVASGELRPTGTDQCVTSLDGQSERLQLRPCRGQDENQLWQVTQQGDFLQNNMSVCTSDMTSLHLERTCADRHNWVYKKDGTMYHQLLQLCLQGNQDGSVEITICDSSSSQQWSITRT